MLLVEAGLAGCMSTAKHYSESEIIPPEILAKQDPDPDKEKEGPKFCNPAGKSGRELEQCHAQNESYYKEFDEEAKRREPWFNFTPDSWASSPMVEEKYLTAVTQLEQAVAKLEQKPWVELEAEAVKLYTGKPAASFAGRKPYLVRALVYFPAAGKFSVFHKDGSILVRHDSVGKETPPEKRSAIVAYLPFEPKTVYVDCGVAEQE